MYGSPPKIPPAGRRPKRPKNQAVTRTGTPVSLSRGLTQSLGHGIYQGLFQGFTARVPSAVDAREIEHVRLPGEDLAPSIVETVRRVSLLSGETVTHTFCPQKGLVPQPVEQGRMLVLTNLRIFAFGQGDGMRETVLMPVEEIKAVAVNAGRRSNGMLLQGGLMVLAGVFFYVLLAYWLTGRVNGPTIPFIRMDLVAFLVFLAVLSGVGMIAQFYFSTPDGEVTFQGAGMKVTFPFKGETDENHIYQVVNATFAARQKIVGVSAAENSGLGVR